MTRDNDAAQPEAHRSGRGRRSPTRSAKILLLGVAVLAAGIVSFQPALRRDLAYRLRSHTGSPVTSEYVAPSSSDPPTVRFAAMGDIGTGDNHERQTASAADDLESSDEYDAVLVLGDNVYPDGDPDLVEQTVLDPLASVLDGPTRLLPVLGNHDVRNDNGDAQAAELGMPARWYATMTDDTLVVSLDSNRPNDPEQLAWLDTTLATSTASWKIATMHHPPYSGGYHGSSLDVRSAFSPLFERYDVQLVLSGHDHDYQRSRPINGVTYIVTGGAATLRPAQKADFTEVAWSEYHFVDIAIWNDRLQLSAVDQQGRLIDSITLDASSSSHRAPGTGK